MTKDDLNSMIDALAITTREGETYVIGEDWEVTIHAGRPGAMISVQQVSKLTLKPEFLLAETRKSQRVVFWRDEIRGFTAESLGTDKKGRRTGFVG